ncbi:hypothetical protein ERO13_A03G059300v2 [Gossypium hirsutum]|uniref:Uncharacterized protein isoform X2 n=3 Tax=Gossypium TaxID=3633 RepID=A0A1U8NEN0_GOSHI|nr:uncharacterized protein LOC107947346 isoform X2 [Gossypium hirsutum]KAG4207321.1 hypothetical protein ERO13_A03G059300v2 [Gossypium hirsutum]TYH24280.1 hypothetical protein ES288_A03G079400v1 [Gossypium darwinii]TYI35478.1 hypothetical protein ES332_A03G079300v1 [Gossypium tomentosum]
MGENERTMNNIKGKGVAERSRANHNYSGEDEDDDKITSFSFPSVKSSPRNASSKYDFVKVRVWLGDNADHYYVLSRFLLSRMLTVTKIPNHVAIKIALELKKLLIDNSLLDVSQSDLEVNLFKLMERRGYGEEYINRYKMMTRFHHQRVPLVILVCGTACVGKSTIATQLAQRLNLPNVLQTDMVYELLRTATDAPLASTPVWERDFSSSEELITEFCRECRIVRKGLNGDLKKAMKDGKPIIIEGIHLDPSIYLMDDEHKATTSVAEGHQPNPLSVASNSAVQVENNCTSTSGSNVVNSQNHLVHGVPADQVNKVSESLESIALATASENKGETVKAAEVNGSTTRKEKPGPKPIIIPIVLKMAEFDHKALLEERITTRTLSGKCVVQDTDKLITNLKTIQNYLCSFESQGLTVVNVAATTFPQTLDWLHGYLLQCIEQGISSESNEKSRQPAEK